MRKVSQNEYQNSTTKQKNALKSAYLSAFQGICLSFPLHGSGGFGSDVVDNAVDVLDLVCNAV